MQNELTMLEILAPDMKAIIEQRYQILRNIHWNAPIGRRLLAEKVHLTERVLRGECELLKMQHLIETSQSGMVLSKKGEKLLFDLEHVMDSLTGMEKVERALTEFFGNQQCLVIAGDSEKQTKVLEDFGHEATQLLTELLPNGDNIIAVMGGTTMAAIAENFDTLETATRKNVFVPARGGIGESLSVQANTVAANLAAKSGGKYRALYVPEQLKNDTYELLIQEPAIQEVLSQILQSNCVIHSIGRALHMANRRGMSEEEIVNLRKLGAVAESFGYFFNEQGQIVYKLARIGLQLKQLEKIPYIVTIAGGKSKAKAVCAYMKNAPTQTRLILDEACANEILKGHPLL